MSYTETKQSASFTIEPYILQELKKLAKADDRNVSNYVNIVLRNHIEKKEKKPSLKLIKRGKDA